MSHKDLAIMIFLNYPLGERKAKAPPSLLGREAGIENLFES
jgi:hypothetical protein